MDEIKEQIMNNKIVLYMKGTPKFPTCRFSNIVVKILALCQVNNFLAVNVLDDETLRQNIKKYSNWPTIPQLYINGNFIGGSDIVTELYQSGELKKLLDT